MLQKFHHLVADAIFGDPHRLVHPMELNIRILGRQKFWKLFFFTNPFFTKR